MHHVQLSPPEFQLDRSFSSVVHDRMGPAHHIHTLQTAFVDDLTVMAPVLNIKLPSPQLLEAQGCAGL